MIFVTIFLNFIISLSFAEINSLCNIFENIPKKIPKKLIVYDSSITDQPRNFKIIWDSKFSNRNFAVTGEGIGANINEIKDSIKNNQIFQSTNIVELTKGFMPELNEDRVRTFLKDAKMKSYILVPLMSKHAHFGSLIVFSSRESISDSELNFLNL